MDAQTFFKKLDNISDIPTLPSIVLTVNNMLQDYDTTIKNLSNVIEKDQAMVTKILRLVNSTFYGFRSSIKNISHAVIVLGFNTIRNAVVSVSIIKTFSGKDICEGFEIEEFWKHSIAVAVTSRYLAEQTKLDSPEDCFVSGLLHDIGKLVLSQYFTGLFSEVWKSVEKDNLSFYEAEKKLLPVNHAQIGGYLTKKWQFPLALVDSITYHHKIRLAVLNPDQLIVVHTADSIVNARTDDSKGIVGFPPLDPEAKKIMSHQVETVSDWFPDVATEIESACDFFLNQE